MLVVPWLAATAWCRTAETMIWAVIKVFVTGTAGMLVASLGLSHCRSAVLTGEGTG